MVQNSVIVSGLLNDAVCNSGYVVSNDRIINDYEPERIWKEAVVLYMEVQSRYLPQGTARKPRKNLQPGELIFRPRFEKRHLLKASHVGRRYSCELRDVSGTGLLQMQNVVLLLLTRCILHELSDMASGSVPLSREHFG